MSPGFWRYFSNTSWLLGGRVIQTFCAFFIGIYVIRYLGPDKLGMLSYAFMLVGLFMIFGEFGLHNIIIRELVENPEHHARIMGTAFRLRLAGILLAWGLLCLFLTQVEEDPVVVLLIVIAAAGCLPGCLDGMEENFIARVNSKYIVIATMIAMATVLSSRLLLVYLEADVIAFGLVNASEALVATIGLIYFYRRKGDRISGWEWHTPTAVKLLRNSWPFILSSFAALVYMRIDQVMIRQMLGIHEVGLYAVSVILSEAWYFIPVLIASSLFPAIVNARKTDATVYQERLLGLYQMMIWLALAVAICVTFLASFIVPYLYGEEFLAATNSLKIHIWGGIFIAVGTVNKSYLTAENLQKYLAISVVSGALINVLLNYLLIPIYGIEGAAISTIISYFYASFFGLYLISKTRNVCTLMMTSVFRTAIPRQAWDRIKSRSQNDFRSG